MVALNSSNSHNLRRFRRRVVYCQAALIAAVLIMSTAAVQAEDAQTPAETPPADLGSAVDVSAIPAADEALSRRVEELATQVEQISTQLDESVMARRLLEEQISARRQAAAEHQATNNDEERPDVVTYSRAAGLRFQPHDQFRFTLRGFLWARYTGANAPGEGEIPGERSRTNNFSMSETRIKLIADLGGGLVRAVFQPSVSYASPGYRPGIQDAYLELRIDPALNFRVGQHLVNYDWESNTGPPMYPAAGVSSLARYYGHGRDLGLMIYGTLLERFQYRVGFFNGGGRMSPNDDDSLIAAVMIRWLVTGSLAPEWGWTDLLRDDQISLTLGAAGTFDRRTREELDQQVWQGTANIHLRGYGMGFAFVGHLEGIQSDNMETSEYESHLSFGALVHLGYVPWRERLEVFARFVYHDPNLELDEDAGTEVTGGATLFLLGQAAKLTLQYTWQRNMWFLPANEGDADAHVVLVEAQGRF